MSDSQSHDRARERRPPFHKRHYIIDKPFQIRLMGTMMSLWLANSLFFAVVVYFFYQQHLIQFYYLFPRPETYPLVSVPELLAIAVAFVSMFGLVVLVIVALYMSNQIAGPLYRTKQSLVRVGRGEFGVRLQFRQRDFLREIPAIFNSMLDGLRQQAEAEIEELKAIENASGEPAELKRLIRAHRERKETRNGLATNGADSAVPEPQSVAVPVH